VWEGVPATHSGVRAPFRCDDLFRHRSGAAASAGDTRGRFNFLREAKLWYSRDTQTAVLGEEFENEIVLSDEFYSEINAHRNPTDLEAVKLLMSSPAVLDLFMWLGYRSFTARGEERIPLFGPEGLTAQLGSVEYARPRKFRGDSSCGWTRSNNSGPSAVRRSLQTARLWSSGPGQRFIAERFMLLPSPGWILLHWDAIRWRMQQSWTQRLVGMSNPFAVFRSNSGDSAEIRLGRLLLAARSESHGSRLEHSRVLPTIEAYISESEDVEVRALVKRYLSES
jgi:hypothetical protein